ncbi:PAS domain-containing protein [Methanoregula sp. PtaB.Bin085]|uniref:PAS domain-containing protein n=1 Tax=Methanoregula sp. PtaB.Bin085 TaxID=1811680 RepID=UPI0009CE1FBE|nr:PAS domain S-box protein [Methanoregula sp. PtaB.Bin085]OPX64595.1 MAG: sensory histidine kinase AtoS [Methanoregula sp. PtaB.Bin085]
MKTISTTNTLWLSVTALLTIGIILVSIFSLKNGYYDIYPYFYILPIIMIAYFYPRYSVYITILLGWVFLGLVYLYGPLDIRLYTTSFAFFYVFVSIGIVITAFSGQLMHERRYRQIFENSQAGIFTFDLELQQIREVNLQAASILGYARDDLAAMLFSTLWFDDDQEMKFMKKIRMDGHIADMEIALRKKDRTVIWVLVTAARTDEDWVVCSIVDITESKRMKDELIESELRYRTLFDGASDAIFLHDLDGRIFETNVIASRYLGYSKKEFMQMRMHDIDTRPEVLFTREVLQDLSARGHLLFETVHRKKDGTHVPVEISSRITEYFGMSAVMSTVRDISERRKE